MQTTPPIDWEQFEYEELERIAELEKKSAVKRWAKYKRPNPFWRAYGFGSTLYKLKGDMDNPELTPITRRAAAEAFYTLLHKLEDKKLMAMRGELIQAAQAGDSMAVAQISYKMKMYSHEDPETGHYGV